VLDRQKCVDVDEITNPENCLVLDYNFETEKSHCLECKNILGKKLAFQISERSESEYQKICSEIIEQDHCESYTFKTDEKPEKDEHTEQPGAEDVSGVNCTKCLPGYELTGEEGEKTCKSNNCQQLFTDNSGCQLCKPTFMVFNKMCYDNVNFCSTIDEIVDDQVICGTCGALEGKNYNIVRKDIGGLTKTIC